MAAAAGSTVPHILVVDDEPNVREAIGLALGNSYVVHQAASGREACALLQKQPVAAIILDAILGEEHGLDLIARFRDLSQASILVLTGHGTEELAIRAIRAKADDYLKKPVSLPDLRSALARLVHPGGLAEDPVESARRLMIAHLDRAHTTESLARMVGLSGRQFHRRFTEAAGTTPRRYLTELRMEHAAHLLCATALGIEQIAHRVGYQDSPTFVKVFTRATGRTPTAYRANPPAKAPVPRPRRRGPRRV